MSDSPVRERWYQNSAVISAIITGVLGLAGTWLSMRNTREPSVTAVAETEPIAEVSSTPNVDYRLNFSQFQRQATDASLSEAQRAVLAEEVLDQSVIWKGYVDEVIPMTEPSDVAAVTVTLVEAKERIDQSMFKTPAIFRFGREAARDVEGLQTGQQVILTGVVTHHSLVGTIVEDGRVLR